MIKKRILVIGGTGMLGHMVYLFLKELNQFEVFNSVYRNKLTEDSYTCNVKDQNSIFELLNDIQPSIVINCVGALVKESAETPSSAIYLNALLPHLLKDLCNQRNAKLIHISTDCVFSGKKGNYSENDFRDADDVYGRSKSLGEIFEKPHTTLRTSIIGPELKSNGSGLLNWFLTQNETINGFSNAYWGGVTTLELAKAIEICINEELSGLYHVTNGNKISKYELLHLFKKETPNKNILINNYSEYISDKSLMKSDKYNFNVPSYSQMIEELFIFMNSNLIHYPNYYGK